MSPACPLFPHQACKKTFSEGHKNLQVLLKVYHRSTHIYSIYILTHKRNYTHFEINGILLLTRQKHKTCDKM